LVAIVRKALAPVNGENASEERTYTTKARHEGQAQTQEKATAGGPDSIET
jgi:hypothetical protein